MATKAKNITSTTIQLWPRGTTISYHGEGDAMRVRLEREERWRKPTADEARAIRIEEAVDRLINQDILCCDSSLVTDCLRLAYESSDECAREWDTDKFSNMRADPSAWNLARCKEWLDDNGYDHPDPDPWSMDRETMLPLFTVEYTRLGRAVDLTDEQLRSLLVEDIDDEVIDGLEAWRELVNDHAGEHEAEVYEWWRVTDWFARKLETIGECVLDNNYGTWWGRQATGQSMEMDGTLQRVAALIVD
jgi:hypothetical protein